MSTTITGLPAAGALSGTEPVPVDQAGSTARTTTADIAALAQLRVQFRDEGTALGSAGTVTEINFAGAGITATRLLDAITVTVANAGTLTSVGLSGGTTGLTVSGSPVTGASGTMTLEGTLLVAHGGTGGTTQATARSGLGLGGAATLNVGTVAGTVAAGDDSRIVNAVPSARTVSAGTGLTGGGALSANITLTMSNTGVTAGSYGTATQVPQIAVDSQGRVTSASNVTISIPASAVTMNTARLLGRTTAGAGVVEEITVGTGLSLSGGTLVATGGGSGQAAIQFQDEGANLGSSGTATTLNFVGPGVTAARTVDTITVTVSGGGGGAINGYVDEAWINPFIGFLAAGAAIPANTICLVPFKVVRDITINGLGARVTTSGATNCQIAIYANNTTTGRPTGNALVNTGNLSTAATGVISEVGLTATTLTANTIYWAGVNIAAGGPVLQSNNGAITGTMTNFIGSATLANISSGTGTGSLHLRVAQTFGTWPDLTSASITENTGNTTAVVFLRVSDLP